jgi:hypothetical protein
MLVLGSTPTAVLAQVQWSPDPNVNNPVAVVADVQSFPIVVTDTNDGAIFAWRSARFDVGTGTIVYDIYAQRFDRYGVALWPATGVQVVAGSVSAAGSPMDRPFGMVAVPLSQGSGAILAWHDIRNAPDAGDIYAQKLSNNGIPQWTVGGMPVTTAFGLQDRPALVADDSGGAVFTWQDRRAGPLNCDVYAQRLNASGLPQWVATGVPVSSAPGDQVQPTIVPTDLFGGFVDIAWVDSRSGNQDIYAQDVSLAGGPQWMLDGVPVTTPPGTQNRPALATGRVIAWEDDRNGGDKDVYAQALSPAGVPRWTPNGVQVANTPNASAPIVVSDFGGGAFIAWQDARNGPTNVDVFAQELNSSGVPLWTPNGVTVSGAAGNQVSPVGIPLSVGGPLFFVVAWEDARNGASDVFAQRIELSGAAAWTPNGVPISTAANLQAQVSMVGTIFDVVGAILVWEDDRNGATSTDIYAAKVGLNGVLPVALQGFAVE